MMLVVLVLHCRADGVVFVLMFRKQAGRSQGSPVKIGKKLFGEGEDTIFPKHLFTCVEHFEPYIYMTICSQNLDKTI